MDGAPENMSHLVAAEGGEVPAVGSEAEYSVAVLLLVVVGMEYAIVAALVY